MKYIREDDLQDIIIGINKYINKPISNSQKQDIYNALFHNKEKVVGTIEITEQSNFEEVMKHLNEKEE